MRKKSKRSIRQNGLTMLEVLIVIAVIAVLTVGLFVYLSPIAQAQKVRDSKRKTELNSLQQALELYRQDNATYPINTSDYQIPGAPWGSSWGNYMKKIPQDVNNNYVYISDGHSYKLFASLERGSSDPQACNGGNACNDAPEPQACGGVCNYEIGLGETLKSQGISGMDSAGGAGSDTGAGLITGTGSDVGGGLSSGSDYVSVTPTTVIVSGTPTVTPGILPSDKIVSCGKISAKSFEPNVLYAYSHESGGAGGYADAIKVWYTDELPITLGAGSVSEVPQYVTGVGKFYGGHVHNPNVGDLTQKDKSDFSYAPMLFLTDITNDPSDTSGDGQNGGVGIPPSDIYGIWKSLGNYNYGTYAGYAKAGGDPVPNGNNYMTAISNVNYTYRSPSIQPYTTELVWDASTLTVNGQPLQPGHSYRAQFSIHDGDTDAVGNGRGVGCVTIYGK